MGNSIHPSQPFGQGLLNGPSLIVSHSNVAQFQPFTASCCGHQEIEKSLASSNISQCRSNDVLFEPRPFLADASSLSLTLQESRLEHSYAESNSTDHTAANNSTPLVSSLRRGTNYNQAASHSLGSPLGELHENVSACNYQSEKSKPQAIQANERKVSKVSAKSKAKTSQNSASQSATKDQIPISAPQKKTKQCSKKSFEPLPSSETFLKTTAESQFIVPKKKKKVWFKNVETLAVEVEHPSTDSCHVNQTGIASSRTRRVTRSSWSNVSPSLSKNGADDSCTPFPVSTSVSPKRACVQRSSSPPPTKFKRFRQHSPPLTTVKKAASQSPRGKGEIFLKKTLRRKILEKYAKKKGISHESCEKAFQIMSDD